MNGGMRELGMRYRVYRVLLTDQQPEYEQEGKSGKTEPERARYRKMLFSDQGAVTMRGRILQIEQDHISENPQKDYRVNVFLSHFGPPARKKPNRSMTNHILFRRDV